MRKWQNLPSEMQNDEVKYFYNILKKRWISRILKILFDFTVSLFALILLAIPFLIIGLIIKCDSSGPIFYRQERYTIYRKKFKIYKFRTMVVGADKSGSLITCKDDLRITKFGSFLRKSKLDELPQVINVFLGQMSFVGIRPEVEKYVLKYDSKMQSTFLMKAGITSLASIKFKDENALIDNNQDVDFCYLNNILPTKMQLNYDYLEHFNFWKDISYVFKTIF